MCNMKNENKNLNEVGELKQQTSLPPKMSPSDEYERFIKKRKDGFSLFFLFCIVEIIIGIFAFNLLNRYDLNYRVTRELENSLTGQNRFSTGIYTGKTDFGYFIGNGKFEYVSGSSYSGAWDDNSMKLGVLNVPSEGKYEGTFLNSQKSGTGEFTWVDGTIYSGEWKDDQMSGTGIYTSPEEIQYSGMFEDNKFKTGICTFSNSTGDYTVKYKNFKIDNLEILYSDGTTYNGGSDGKELCGLGTMNFPNDEKYSGYFELGKRNGAGTYIWSNGDIYDGSWLNDMMDGSGIYTYSDGSCAKGNFSENQFVDGSYSLQNDFGKYDFTIKKGIAVSIKMTLKSGTTYSGNLKDENLTGDAQISYSNGDTYSGKVNDGYKSGQGIYRWKSGAYYEGGWHDDKMQDRQGTYYYPKSEDGFKLVGNFDKGYPNGECKYYTSSSKYYKTDWSYGRCVKIYE